MKKFTVLLIGLATIVTMLTYGFDFPFTENSTGFNSVKLQTPSNFQSQDAVNKQLSEGVNSLRSMSPSLVTSFVWSQPTSTFTTITGGVGTVVLATGAIDDNNYGANPIGFSFIFDGAFYNQFGLNANGWISMGNVTPSNSYTPISTGTTRNIISAMAQDLLGQATGAIEYQTSGVTPNRVLTIQWSNWAFYSSGSPDGSTLNFQIKLFETSNNVQIIYGSNTSSATSHTVQVGIGGAVTTDYNNRTTTTDWSGTTAGVTNADACTFSTTAVPATDLTFLWTSPVYPSMAYTSSTTTQNTSSVPNNTVNNQVIGMQVVTTGMVSPINVTQLNLTTTGSTNPSTDIRNAKVFYTGLSGTFATTAQFGTVVTNPNGTFSITGSQALSEGTNYFWLTYDIPLTATLGNVVDATCNQITLGTLGSVIPTITDPAGNRLIVGPLSGTYTINNTLPTGGTNYASFTDAINTINVLGISGPVTFNVTAGQTFTEILPALTATGTAVNTITFQKFGAGANPLVTRTDAGTLTTSTLGAQGDAIITIDGSDYLTFDGINVTATNSGIEYGYYLRRLSPTDGCKNVTIKNATVTMTKGTSAYVAGIYSSNNTVASTVGSATGIILTSTGGRTENLTIIGDTIQNVHACILLRGYGASAPNYDFYDQNNVIGQSGTGNTIQNYGGGSATASYAVYMIYQNNPNINYNTINNTAGGGSGFTSTGYGIFHSSATNGSGTYNNNTITLTATTGQLRAIMSGTAGLATLTANNNTISLSQASTSPADGIYFSSITAGSTVNINNNNFSYGTFASTTASYMIYNSNGADNQTVTGNKSTGTITKAGAGALYGYYNAITTAAIGTATINNNNFSNITLTGASGFYGIYQTSSFSQNILITNDTISNITGGTTAIYGIYQGYGNAGSSINGNSVFNLSSTTGAIYGIYTGAAGVPSGLTVYNNSIYNLSSTGTLIVGLYNNSGVLNNIYQNKIYNLSASNASGAVYGMQLAGSTASTYAYVYNNFISDLKSPIANSTTDLIRGINITSTALTSAFGLYYNTIYLNAASSGANFASTGIYHTYGALTNTAALDMRDNIVVNASTQNGTGIAAAFRRSASTDLNNFSSLSNNNCLNAGTPSATRLIYYDGTNSDQTIASYKTRVSPRDNYSFSELPPFVNVATAPYDLHIQTTVPTQCEKGGTPVTSPIAITTDYDANVRNATLPDVGADEFNGLALDLIPPSISYTPLSNTGSLLNRTLNVTVTDASGVPTTSTGWPNLYWKKNAGAYTASTPTTVSGSVYTYTFGAGVVSGDVISYYVVARDLAATPNIGAYPSAGAGGFTFDPPAAGTPPTTPSSYTITATGLTGDYTVGLTLFNKVAGKNITFNKVVSKVLKEVMVEDPSTQKQIPKGEIREPDTLISSTAKGRTELREVEEVTWIPIENGKEYTGDLYIKKSENPNYDYPEGVNGIYSTVTAAVNDLNLRGVSGPVRFLLNDASYTTETLPIVVNVKSADVPTATNTVTFKPNTGVTTLIQGATTTGNLMRILSSYVIIDGSNTEGGTTKNLTIQNTGITAPSVLYIASVGTTPITNVTLKNSNIINGVNTSTAILVRDSSGTAGYFNNITIQNDSIQLAYIALYCSAVSASGNGSGLNITGNSINTSGTNAVSYIGIYVQGADGATVTNNNVGNFVTTTSYYRYGIWFATGTVNSTISNNNVGNLNTSTSYYPYGITLTPAVANSNITVTGNTIHDFTSTSSGDAVTGIYAGGASGGIKIQKNLIYHMYNTYSGGYGAWGICLSSSLQASNIEVSNNMIYDVMAYGYASTLYENGIGIFFNSGGGYNIYYNSVNLYTNQSAGQSMCLYFTSSIATPSSINIRNNIFANNETTLSNYCIYSAAPKAVFADINYNDYYAASATNGYVGYYGGNKVDLAAWQTAIGKDGNSVSGDPKFLSSTNLHIDPTPASPVFNAGIPIAGITTDYDGDTRSVTTPCIGADEYAPIVTTLLSPANGSTGLNNAVRLVWAKVALADSYRLQISTDSTFATTVVNTNLTDTTYTFLGSNLKYYWRVNPVYILYGNGTFSTVFNFSTLGTPTRVTLVAPVNGAVDLPVIIRFVWNKAFDGTPSPNRINSGAPIDISSYFNKTAKTKTGNNGDNVRQVGNYMIRITNDTTLAPVYSDSTITDTTTVISGFPANQKFFWNVSAKNEFGWGMTSVWFNATTIPLPGTPIAVSPPFDTIGVSTTPILVWTRTFKAATYTVEMSTDSLFGTLMFSDSLKTDTTENVTGLLKSTKYFWRVRAENGAGYSDWAYSKFTTASTPTPVTLVSPNNVINQPVGGILFTWRKLNTPNIAGYWFEITKDTVSGTPVVIDSTFGVNDTSTTKGGFDYFTNYYWRVKAKNDFGWGDFSLYFRFQTEVGPPSLVYPANNSVGIVPTVTLDWDNAPGAATYRIQLSADSTFATTLLNVGGWPTSQYTVPNGLLSILTNYYWRVNSTNVNSTSIWSPVFKFRTMGLPLVVTLVTPANNAINVPAVNTVFNWYSGQDQTFAKGINGKTDINTEKTGVNTGKTINDGKELNSKNTGKTINDGKELNSKNTGKTGTDNITLVSRYWFELVTDTVSMANLVRDTTLTDTTKTIASLSNMTNYYFRVKGKNEIGWGSFSGWNKFTTIVATPTLISPANNAIDVTLTPVLNWSDVPTATTYDMQLATDTGFTALVYNLSGLTSSDFTVPVPLNNFTNYYWRARATNANGTSDFSARFTFRTLPVAPLAPVLLSPADGSTGLTLPVTLVWSKVFDAYSYRLQVATDAGFTTLVFNDSTLTDTSKVIPGLQPATTYYWRVNSKNITGTSAFTAPWSFRALGVPNPVTLLNPPNGAIDQPTTIMFVWSKAIEPVARPIGGKLSGSDGPLAISKYYFELTRDTVTFAGLYRDSTTTDTTLNVGSLLTNRDYFWRVKAQNQNGNGTFTGWSRFKTIVSNPLTPVLLLPINNAVNQPTTMIFKWSKVNDNVDMPINSKTNKTELDGPLTISKYYFELTPDTVTFAGIYRDSTVAGPSDTTLTRSGLTNNLNYYWRVRARNQAGLGPFTGWFKFTTVVTTPIAPVLTSPANNATGVSLTPALTWGAVTGAVSYRIQVSTDNTFATTQFDTAGVAGTTLTVPAGKLTGLTQYFWRVNATNAGGTGPYSTVFNFTTLQILTLNLKVYLEGFWNGTAQVSDSTTVYLANATTPYAFIDTAKIILSTTGTATINFTKAPNGSYYIVVNHRNHLETWSKLPQVFATNIAAAYDFTTAANMAFGDNMKQVGSVWVLYGGDGNRDGSVDALDVAIFIVQFGNSGYLSCDFNGDGSVDALDVPIIIANFGLGKAVPTLDGGILPPNTNKGKVIEEIQKKYKLNGESLKKETLKNKN